jgi:hypothetical protein
MSDIEQALADLELAASIVLGRDFRYTRRSSIRHVAEVAVDFWSHARDHDAVDAEVFALEVALLEASTDE